jgi:hypothetical protein
VLFADRSSSSGAKMNNVERVSVAAALAAACLLGCSKDSAGPDPSRPAASASTAMPAPPPTGGPASAAGAVSGTVAETMDAAQYLRITTPTGDRWAAVPQTKVNVGQTVTIQNPMAMPNFKSPTLNRTFPEILFGTLAGASAVTPVPTASGAGAAVPAGPVPKAPGPTGHTVAEVFAGKATLADKPVAIRGRVTKFNAGILDRNWIHLSDGSGSKASGDDDLTVTTSDTAAVGDIILVRGVVHLAKDFGAGYSYPVIVEDAKIDK